MISERLKLARKNSNLTQGEVAKNYMSLGKQFLVGNKVKPYLIFLLLKN